jgi:hypothetical protein
MVHRDRAGHSAEAGVDDHMRRGGGGGGGGFTTVNCAAL